VRLDDLIGTAVGGLWRQKARTALTLLGVTVGVCALAFCLSLGFGLRKMIDDEFRGRPGFWLVHVRADQGTVPVPESEIPPKALAIEGDVSPERKARLRERLVEKYHRENPGNPPARLTPEKVAEIAGHPDVAAVETWHFTNAFVRLEAGPSRDVPLAAGRIDRPTIADRIVLGRMPKEADELLVSEALLYDLGVRSEAEFAALIGRKLTLTVGEAHDRTPFAAASLLGLRVTDLTQVQEDLLAKVALLLKDSIEELALTSAEKQLLLRLMADAAKKPEKPHAGRGLEKTVAVEYRIAGVVRGLTRREQQDETRADGWEVRMAQVLLPTASGDRLFDQIPAFRDRGFRSAEVRVRPGGDLRSVVETIDRAGFQNYNSLKYYDSSKREVTLISAGLNLFAMISLFIAALGITNTLVTSVLERTREIGILKALGATDRQVLLLFLMEGALVGLIGGLAGLALAWLLSIPGDRLVRHLVQEQSHEKLLSESVFEFPLWLIVGAVLFSVVVTTLAALYPARRAARIQPVEALRHE